MRLTFCTDIKDEELGIVLFPDVEGELEADILNRRDARFDITAIYIEGKNLYRGDDFARRLAVTLNSILETEINTSGTRLHEMAVAELQEAA